MSDLQITDVSTTESKMRCHAPRHVDIVTTELTPDSVAVKCGNFEIRPLPLDVGESGPPRYEVLINGERVASKHVALSIGVDRIAHVTVEWLPDLSQWKGA